MSERQRLITKYVSGLIPQILMRYELFFLRQEYDESAKKQLIDSMTEIGKNVGNADLFLSIKEATQSRNASLLYGQIREKPDQKRPKNASVFDFDDHSSSKESGKGEASRYYSHLQLGMALKALEKSKGTMGNFEIAICNFCMDRFSIAAAYAKKSQNHRLALVMSVANGNFEDARKEINYILPTLSDTPDNNHVVTTYELLHLITFIFLATETSTTVAELPNKLSIVSNYEIDKLNSLLTDFGNRNFTAFNKQFSTITNLLSLSIYTEPCLDSLVNQIKANMVYNITFPLARAKIKAISMESDVNEQHVVSILQRYIASGQLPGKLDLIAGEYIGGINDSDFFQTKQSFERVLYIRQAFESVNYLSHSS